MTKGTQREGNDVVLINLPAPQTKGVMETAAVGRRVWGPGDWAGDEVTCHGCRLGDMRQGRRGVAHAETAAQ